MPPNSYYDILGVSPNASEEEIKKTYRKLASEWHPDKNNGDLECVKKFKEINEAYSTTGDPAKRSEYDNKARKTKDIPSDIWEEILKPFSTRARDAVRREIHLDVPGDNSYMSMNVTFVESFSGTKKELATKVAIECNTCGGTGAKPGTRLMNCGTCAGVGHINDPFTPNSRGCPTCMGRKLRPLSACTTCVGTGQSIVDRTITISIPQGIRNDDTLRIPNKGKPGNPPGDLFIKIIVEPSIDISRIGNNVHMTIDVPMYTLMLGGPAVVNMPWGIIHKIDIKPNTPSGAVKKIGSAGFKTSEGQGEVLITLNASLPEIKSEEVKEALLIFIKALDQG